MVLMSKGIFSAVIQPLLGLEVDYLGELNTVDKYALLGGEVALVNPLQWPEPFDMVMIEAMAVGVMIEAMAVGSGAGPGRVPAHDGNVVQCRPTGRRAPEIL